MLDIDGSAGRAYVFAIQADRGGPQAAGRGRRKIGSLFSSDSGRRGRRPGWFRVGTLFLLTGLVTAAIAPGIGGAQVLEPLRPGPNNDITDVEGILVGHFTNLTAPYRTGTSVLLLPDKAVAGVDVRGGGPGTSETDVLDGRGPVDKVDAVFLSGGSAYGLASRTGVVQCVDEAGKGFQLAGRPSRKMPMVVGAIIFDLGRGGGFGARPTAEFGYQACKAAAKGPIAQGTVGAGAGASSGGGVKGGFGTASVDLGNGVIVGAVAVVNSVGQTFRSDNCQFYTAYLELGNEYGDLNLTDDCPATTTAAESTEPAQEQSDSEQLVEIPGPASVPVPIESAGPLEGQEQEEESPSPEPSQEPEDPGLPPLQPLNTTIGVVAVNINLSKAQTNRMATAAHDGMARSISPSHTLLDGDTIFSLSTEKVDLACIARATGADEDLVLSDIYSAAADTFSRAVNHAILRATTVGGTSSYCDIRPGVCTGIPVQNNQVSTGSCSVSGGGVLAATGTTSLFVILGIALLIIGAKVGLGARGKRPSREATVGG